jgi:hypothetical protein
MPLFFVKFKNSQKMGTHLLQLFLALLFITILYFSRKNCQNS